MQAQAASHKAGLRSLYCQQQVLQSLSKLTGRTLMYEAGRRSQGMRGQ